MTYTDDPNDQAELRLLRDDLFGERPDTDPPDLTKGNYVPSEGSNPAPGPANLGIRFARELFGGDPNHGYTTD